MDYEATHMSGFAIIWPPNAQPTQRTAMGASMTPMNSVAVVLEGMTMRYETLCTCPRETGISTGYPMTGSCCQLNWLSAALEAKVANCRVTVLNGLAGDKADKASEACGDESETHRRGRDWGDRMRGEG